MAALEEHLQEKYVENYDKLINDDSKVEGIIRLYPEYFYIPSNEGIGSLRYIVDSEGHALYLIKKSGLPKEIQKSLIGGNAGTGTYIEYASLNDVYGVTSDLKVYYSTSNEEKFIGISSNELDMDDSLREVFNQTSNIYSTVSSYDIDKNGVLTSEETRAIKTLEITSSSNITSLKDLYNLSSLKELTLNAVKLENLDGIELATQLNYVCFKNYSNVDISNLDYTALKKVSKLKYLYLIGSCDSQCNKLFYDIQGANYSNLQYLGIYGNRNNVQDISNLALLGDISKKSVKYLSLYSNDITSLEAVSDFINVVELDVYDNVNLTSLNGIENYTSLLILRAQNCDLGRNEIYDELLENKGKNPDMDSLSALKDKKVTKLFLQDNQNLKWISYLKNCNSLQAIDLTNDINIISKELLEIKNILFSCGNNCKFDSKYSLIMLDDTTIRLDLSNQTVIEGVFEGLENNTTIKYLSLKNITFTNDSNVEIEDDIKINKLLNKILGSMTNLKTLQLRGINNLYDASFLKNLTKIEELDLSDTNISTGTVDEKNNKIGLDILEDYCLNLKTLYINNDNDDYTLLQNTISRMSQVWSVKGTWLSKGNSCGTGVYGFYSESQTALNTIANCQNITTFVCGLHLNKSIDLSNCNNLKQVNVYFKSNNNENNTIVLPDSGEYEARFTDVSDNCIKGGKGIKSISITYSYCTTNENFWSLFNDMVDINSKLESIDLGVSASAKDNLLSLNGIEKLAICPKLTSLTISGKKDNLMNDISNLNLLSNLTELSLSNMPFSTIPDLSNLKKLENLTIVNTNITNTYNISRLTSLTNLTINKNNIVSIRDIEKLKNLKKLNLEDNCLYDTFTYKDEDNTSKTIVTLSLIENLNPQNGGNLEEIYLAGNSGITNFSRILNLIWVKKSGF